jgi:hypothetical protein
MINDITGIIGKTIFVPIAEQRNSIKQCPICFGSGEVTLLLVNGDSYKLPCDYCGKGFDYPMGTVTEWEFFVGVVARVVNRVDIQNAGSADQKIDLISNYNVSHPETSYWTREEALIAAEALKIERENEEETRTEYLKHNTRKSFSWNAGYHSREVKALEKRIEHHKKKAVLCKAKAKEEKDTPTVGEVSK